MEQHPWRDPEQLALMKRIDEIHLKHPFLVSRKVSNALRAEGKWVPADSYGTVHAMLCAQRLSHSRHLNSAARFCRAASSSCVSASVSDA